MAEFEGSIVIGDDEGDSAACLVDQCLADEVATEIGAQRGAVEELLNLVGGDGAGQPEFQRSAPGIGNEVAPAVALLIVVDGEKTQVMRHRIQTESSPDMVALLKGAWCTGQSTKHRHYYLSRRREASA
jgi:hypothetical protein